MDKLYQRNLIKNKIQDYLLYFVYNSGNFKDLIFTGGTCLKKLYNLPRLSEDLDFDYQNQFNIKVFENQIKKFFSSLKILPIPKIKIANNQKTIFFKFLAVDFIKEKIIDSKEIIFVRCDFSQVNNKSFKTEISPYRFENFNFFIKNYDLPTLFANKILAFLERKFFKGKEQKTAFKGRDIFDIFWFIDFSAKSGFTLKPNWLIIQENFPNLKKEEIVERLIDKLIKIDEKEIFLDLSPFIADQNYLKNFLENYRDFIKNKIKFII